MENHEKLVDGNFGAVTNFLTKKKRNRMDTSLTEEI